MRVLQAPQPEVRVTVELTGRELQIIDRALQYVKTPLGTQIRADEDPLREAFYSLLSDWGLDHLDA